MAGVLGLMLYLLYTLDNVEVDHNSIDAFSDDISINNTFKAHVKKEREQLKIRYKNIYYLFGIIYKLSIRNRTIEYPETKTDLKLWHLAFGILKSFEIAAPCNQEHCRCPSLHKKSCIETKSLTTPDFY